MLFCWDNPPSICSQSLPLSVYNNNILDSLHYNYYRARLLQLLRSMRYSLSFIVWSSMGIFPRLKRDRFLRGDVNYRQENSYQPCIDPLQYGGWRRMEEIELKIIDNNRYYSKNRYLIQLNSLQYEVKSQITRLLRIELCENPDHGLYAHFLQFVDERMVEIYKGQVEEIVMIIMIAISCIISLLGTMYSILVN